MLTVTDPVSAAATADFVNVTGDTMTGDLTMAANILASGSRTVGAAATGFATGFFNALRPANDTALTVSTVRVAAGAGDAISLTAAAGVTNSAGGAVNLTAGAGAGAAAGGGLTFTGGAGGTGAGGTGGSLTFAAGAAGAGSAANGGDVILRTGAGDGAGTKGVIRWDDQGVAMSVLPTTTNLVSVGSASLALLATYTRIVQADTGQTMLVRRGDGTTVFTFGNASTTTVSGGLNFLDTVFASFGTSDDSQIRWSTSSANNALYVITNVNSAAQSGNVILTAYANRLQEHGLAAVATPRFSIFSAADMSVAGNRTQYIQMYHDGTNANVSSGVGVLRLRPGGFTIFDINGTTTGGTYLSMTQNASTSGSPTGLLWTGGAHTTLTASVESIDQNWNNARTVQFATGALATQRSFLIQAPTYGFVGASTLTDAVTFAVTGAPGAGTNATFTRRWAATFGTLEATTRTPNTATAGNVGLFGAGTVELVVRDTTNDVEGVLAAGSTGIIFGAATNHSVLLTVNNATVLTLAAASLTFADAVDMAFNATTGTKIGTATSQKFAFWNATPVVQQAHIADPSGGATQDAEARTAINAINALCATLGLTAAA